MVNAEKYRDLIIEIFKHVYSILYENKYKTFLKNDDNEAKTWYYNYTR